jgi:hypothetical protein
MDTRVKPAYDEHLMRRAVPLADPPRRQRESELRLTVATRQCGHCIVIVRHMPEGYAPDAVGKFQDRVARVRRAGLNDMRMRMDIAIARRADTAGIDDHASVAKPDRARYMGVPQRISRCVIPFAACSIASSDDIGTVPSGKTVSSQ